MAATIASSSATYAQQPRLSDLDAYARSLVAVDPHLSFSVAVVRGDSVLHLAGYGPRDASGAPVTPQTAYYIASSTKSFTALTAAILAQRGVVDLDAPIQRYAPEFSLPAPLDASRITLRRLLSHRGGFESGALAYRTAYIGNVPQDSLFSLIARTARPVDSTFTYTNTAYIVAARVLERVTGTPWQDLLAREVFGPLKLRQTTARPSQARGFDVAVGYGPGPDGFAPVKLKADAIMHPAGGMLMSAADASVWLRAQLGLGAVGGRQVLKSEAIRLTRDQLATQRDPFQGIERFGYALGWQMGAWAGDTLYHHLGNYPGTFAHVSFIPTKGLGVAVFANTEMPALGPLSTTIAQKAYDLVLGRRERDSVYQAFADSLPGRVAGMRDVFIADHRRRASRPRVPSRGWAAFAGVYADPDLGSLRIVAIGDTAAELQFGIARARVEVLSGDTLRIDIPAGRSGAPMPVIFNAAGVAERVRIGRAEFMRQPPHRQASSDPSMRRPNTHTP